ncbi:hypothetical protein CC86DRAFT_280925, partial [Ophiobolus disseminans]
TPDYALTLIRTVSQANINPLRAALCGHVARDTALRVTAPVLLFFQLELHLPYLTLRGPLKAGQHGGAESTESAESVWYDVSFMTPRSTDSERSRHCVIYDAHTSLVIAGWDRSKYTGYAFLDPGSSQPHFDEEQDANNESGDDEDDEEEEEDEIMESDPIEDYFATDGREQFQDANLPIWDPRVTFLRAVQTRVHLALQEYCYLTRHVDADIQAWMKINMGLTAGLPANWKRFESPLSDGELSDCIAHMTQLVRQLREHLSKMTWVWTKFEGVHGDMAYFSDLHDPRATIAIDCIRDAFTGLESLAEQLAFREESCKEAAKIVTLRNSVLNQENNKLTRRALDLNVETSQLSKRTTDLAATSLEAVKETSRITRISVYLVLTTTPFIIALQYFTSERKLFAFERNPRTFFLSICILMSSFFVLALSLYGVDTYKWILFRKIYEKMGGKERPPQQRIAGE